MSNITVAAIMAGALTAGATMAAAVIMGRATIAAAAIMVEAMATPIVAMGTSTPSIVTPMGAILTLIPKSAIRFLFTQTLPAGRGIFSPFCVSERAPPVRYALRRQFRSHPQAFWGVLAAAPPPTPSSWRQRRRECRIRDHDVSGMTHPSCMKRTQRSRIAVNTASMAELIFKNVCLPCRTILPAV